VCVCVCVCRVNPRHLRGRRQPGITHACLGHPHQVGWPGPNLKPGTVCVCGMSSLRNGMNTSQHPPSPASRAGNDPPANVQAVSRAVPYVNTHRPRFQVRTRPSYESWPLQDILLPRGFCSRINHPFDTPLYLHCPHCCYTIARLLRTI